MASSSGTSSGFDEDQQLIIDQKKQKRKLSNRESARRSRTRKQNQLDNLTAQVCHLRKENTQVVNCLNMITQKYLNAEAENSVLRTQIIELSNRLEFLNEILICIYGSNGFDDATLNNQGFMDTWVMPLTNQPIMACSSDMFQYSI